MFGFGKKDKEKLDEEIKNELEKIRKPFCANNIHRLFLFSGNMLTITKCNH